MSQNQSLLINPENPKQVHAKGELPPIDNAVHAKAQKAKKKAPSPENSELFTYAVPKTPEFSQSDVSRYSYSQETDIPNNSVPKVDVTDYLEQRKQMTQYPDNPHFKESLEEKSASFKEEVEVHGLQGQIKRIWNNEPQNALLKPTSKFLPHLFWAITATFLSQMFVWVHLWTLNYSGGRNRYSDSTAPLQTSADGYLYLALADGKSAPFGTSLGLSDLLYWLDTITPVPTLWLCYLIPTFCMIIAGLWFAGFGKLLKWSPLSTGIAACVASILPPVLFRTHPGWYDNDPLNLVFWYGGMFAIALLLNHREIFGLLLLLLMEVGMMWTWAPGLILLPMGLGLYAVFFFTEESRKLKIFRMALLIAGIVACLIFLFVPALVPSFLMPYHDMVWVMLNLITETKGDSVGGTIQELSPLAPKQIVTNLGWTMSMGAGLLGCALLFILRFPKIALACVPAFFMLVLTLTAQRFLFLAALPIALGVGALVWSKNKITLVITLILPLFICFTLVSNTKHFGPGLMFDTYSDAAARAIAAEVRKSNEPVAAWNWWDDGYILLSRGEVLSLFNGGNQDNTRHFVSSRPMVQSNPLIARRWMRFFALRGTGGGPEYADLAKTNWGADIWELLEATWGKDWPGKLESVFAANDPATVLATLPPLPVANPLEWLLPKGRVFLYLPQRFLGYSNVWMGFGKAYPMETLQQLHLEMHLRQNIPNYKFGEIPQLFLDKGYTNISAIVNTSTTPITQEMIEPVNSGLYLIDSPLSPYVYIVDALGLRSVAFRLMAPSGVSVDGFKAVYTVYGGACAWEVMP